MATLVSTLLMLTGIFMIMLILLQKGRGGGLAGAFGGMGGQSAFGTKAGDVFTKITVIVAVVWVLLAGASIYLMGQAASGNFSGGSDAAAAGIGPGAEGDAGMGTPPLETTTESGDEGEDASDAKTESESSESETTEETSETKPAEESTEQPDSTKTPESSDE